MMPYGRYRKAVRVSLTSIAAILIFSAALVFIVDPLQYYRKASFYKPYIANARYLNPGLAKHYPYDTVIIGTSMTENFVASEVNKTLGVNVLNLSMAGATIFEEKLILDTAIKTGKVKNVLYCLDYTLFTASEGSPVSRLPNFPFYLYGDSRLTDYKYLLNADSVVTVYYIFAGNLLGSKKKKFDLDRAFNWGRPGEFQKEAALKSFKGYFNPEAKKEPSSLDRLKKNFEAYLLGEVKAHPDINFYVFYPPYSYLAWVDYNSRGLMPDILDFKRYVFENLKGYKNARLYDFQDDSSITFNLDNYKDITHFSPDVNRRITNGLSGDKYLMTEENIGGHLENLRKQIEGVDMEKLKREIRGIE